MRRMGSPGIDTRATLYVILGSHACRTGMLLLEHKRIPYRRVEVPTGLHPFAMRMLGFAGTPETARDVGGPKPAGLATADKMGTVPSLRIDGQRVRTNRAIARHLEEICPEPPLFPADAERRRAVEEAEAWGDGVFQMVARRLVLAASMRSRDALFDRANSGRLGPLLWHHESMRRLGARAVARFVFAADADAEEQLRADLPAHLDRIDEWIAAGVLDGERLNAADLMIAPSLALLSYSRTALAQIEGRPAMGLMDRVLPAP
jgi:glutathione S-transferase